MDTFYYSSLDKTKIQVRILTPSTASNNNLSESLTNSTFKLAIVLHPYGPLGGSRDDGVVGYFSKKFNGLGYLVAVPNMRGVGLSSGKTSWTARSECEDLRALIKLFLDPEAKDLWADQNTIDRIPDSSKHKCSEILIFGYSFGSMIASSFNQDHLNYIVNHSEDSANKAANILPHLKTVLLSYPVSVSWALSLWKHSQFHNDLSTLLFQAQNDEGRTGKVKMLIIFGHEDQFSSFSSYKRWLEKNMIFSLKPSLRDIEGNLENAHVIALSNNQADHFWRNTSLLEWMFKEVNNWVEL